MKRILFSLLVASFVPAARLDAQRFDPRDARWIRLSTSDFELYTCAQEKDGRDLLRSFEQMKGFFQKASPVPVSDDFPIRIVAFETAGQFAFYSPSGKVVAYFSPGPRTDYIVLQDPSRASYPSGIHEYMHLLVKHSGVRLPVWLNEGWADVYSTLRPVRDGVAVGDLIEGRVKTLETSAWADLDVLDSVRSDSELLTENARAGIFYAESWALVHMLFLSPEYADGFPKFLSALNRGRPLADALGTVWGKSTAQVFADLQNYMKKRRLSGRVFEAPLGKAESAVDVTKLDSFDARLMLGDLLVALNRRAEARIEFESLARLRPENLQVSEALGFTALSVKDYDAARINFEKVYAAGGNNPRMCFELALLESRAGRPAERVVEPLHRALQVKPDYVEAQMQLGLYYVASRDYSKAVETLTSIKKIGPDKAFVVFGSLAYAYLQTGDLEKARADAVYAKQWARDARQSAGQDQLIALIDARAKSPFAPRPGERIQRISGAVTAVDCSSGAPRLVLAAGNQTVLLEVPDMSAVEKAHTGQGKELILSCGPQQPVRMIVDYAPASVIQAGPAGVIRRIEY